MAVRNIWRVYIKPFKDDGTYETDYTEVTQYVLFDSVGDIKRQLDNTEYDIGIYRTSGVKITLNNRSGLFSDVGNTRSMFHFRRAGSLVKFTWEMDQPYASGAILGDAWLSTEETIFEGLLNDDSSEMEAFKQEISFNILGKDSIFENTIVPFGSLSNGQLISQVIYTLLNQTTITDLLTISALNISVQTDQAIDDVSPFEGQNVLQALQDLLLAGNSVLYLTDSDTTVKVSARTAHASIALNLYGQASLLGAENIENLMKIKNGFAKTFNYFTYNTNDAIESDATSIATYGAKTKDVSFDFFTDNTKQGNILSALLAEFANPKQEFDVMTMLDYDTFDIALLDRIALDYPPPPTPGNDNLPICGLAICGEAVLPDVLAAFSLDPQDNYKVMAVAVNPKTSRVTFSLRLI